MELPLAFSIMFFLFSHATHFGSCCRILDFNILRALNLNEMIISLTAPKTVNINSQFSVIIRLGFVRERDPSVLNVVVLLFFGIFKDAL